MGKRSRKDRYEDELERLEAELTALQSWVKATGARVVVVFEGRDTAGKGGAIKRIMGRVSPRVFRVVALPAPSDRERTQLYFQRYMQHMPAAGEVILFDRSWYNRGGVERVMGFCTETEAEKFLVDAPLFERQLVEDGVILLKYFLTVGQKEQKKRLEARIEDPRKRWKLSPMDVESYRRWWQYTAAYDRMLSATDTPWAPWWIVPSDDKKSARINLITHMLSQIPYKAQPWTAPDLGKRLPRPEGCPEDATAGRQRTREVFPPG